MIQGYCDMVALLHTELRRLYNRDEFDVKLDGDEERLDRLMDFFGLEKCVPGEDSWDSYEQYCDEYVVGGMEALSYEDYLESDLKPWVTPTIDDDDY